MFGITQPTGGVELVGIEIPCEGRGSAFLRPGDGLNVLYGRNGAGKTSVLAGLRSLVSGVAPEPERVRATALFRVSSPLHEEVFDHLALGYPFEEPDAHCLPPSHSQRRSQHPISFWLDEFGVLESPSAEDVESYLVKKLYPETLATYQNMTVDLSELLDEPSIAKEISYLTLLSVLASVAMEQEQVNPNEDTYREWPLWYLGQLARDLGRDLEVPKDDFDSLSDLATTDDLREFFEALELEVPSVNIDELDVGELRHQWWETLTQLLIYRDMRKSDAEWRWRQSGVQDRKYLAAMVKELVDSRMIAITASGTQGEPAWSVSLAADASDHASVFHAFTESLTRFENRREKAPKRSLGSLVRLTKDYEKKLEDVWQMCGEVFDSLTDEERELINSLETKTQRKRMLFALVALADADFNSEERARAIEEAREAITLSDDDRLVTAMKEDGSSGNTTDADRLTVEDIIENDQEDPSGSKARPLDNWFSITSIDGARYVSSPFVFTTSAFPWALCDLDAAPDPDRVLRANFTSALHDGGLSVATFVEYSDDFEEHTDTQVESESIEQLQINVSDAGEKLNRLGLGIGGLRLRVESDIREWLGEGPVRLEALDAPSQRWVPFQKLSAAQRTWVARILHLQQNLVGGFPLLVVSDEPENGVHATAAHAVFTFFESLGVTSVLASHSTAALRVHDANLVLVDRDFEGNVVLGTPGTGEDVRVAAVQLGTTPLDLLSMKRLLVYVEGSHDEVVVNSVLARSTDTKLADRVIVAPARGVRQFGGVAASVLLTEFTDLHTLIIADNARTDELEVARNEAWAMLKEGLEPSTIKRRMRLAERVGNSEEERVLWDLLERCLDRHVLGRIHFHGLSVRDIIDTLPSSEFGLTEPWQELRQQHSRIRGVDFKSWLRDEKSATISVRTIRSAMDRLDELPEELAAILREIEAADMAARVG